jgi:hypothetical protein
MGHLHYDGHSYQFPDRVLAHLQIVISIKLRRRENFVLNWVADSGLASGREGIWIDNGIPLRFSYEESGVPSINVAWVEALTVGAGRSAGLLLTQEPEVAPR